MTRRRIELLIAACAVVWALCATAALARRVSALEARAVWFHQDKP